MYVALFHVCLATTKPSNGSPIISIAWLTNPKLPKTVHIFTVMFTIATITWSIWRGVNYTKQHAMY